MRASVNPHVSLMPGVEIGPGAECFVIAEAGVNHNGDVGLAMKLIDAAAAAGANAIKFQTFEVDELVTPDAEKAEYQQRTTGSAETQADMLRRLELSHDSFRRIAAYSHDRGILFLSTPFDEGSADFLDELGVPAFKVGSGDLTNLPFLRHIARKRKPMIISTGMATLDEVRLGVDAIHSAGCCESFVLMHCVSCYPAEASEANLLAMKTLREEFGVPVGFSDHTVGSTVAIAAVALGASAIEKHLTTDRTLPGPDHAASLEPARFAEFVSAIRDAQFALGDGVKRPVARELNTAAVARRSIVAACDIPSGTVITVEMLAVRRPGTGIPSSRMSEVVGRRAVRDIRRDTVLSSEMIG